MLNGVTDVRHKMSVLDKAGLLRPCPPVRGIRGEAIGKRDVSPRNFRTGSFQSPVWKGGKSGSVLAEMTPARGRWTVMAACRCSVSAGQGRSASREVVPGPAV